MIEDKFIPRDISSIYSRNELVDYLIKYCNNSIETMRKDNDNSHNEIDTSSIRGQIKFAKQFLKILSEDRNGK